MWDPKTYGSACNVWVCGRVGRGQHTELQVGCRGDPRWATGVVQHWQGKKNKNKMNRVHQKKRGTEGTEKEETGFALYYWHLPARTGRVPRWGSEGTTTTGLDQGMGVDTETRCVEAVVQVPSHPGHR